MRIPSGPVTNALVVLNVAVWLLLWLTGYDSDSAYYFGFIPALMSDALSRMDWMQLAWSALLLPVTAAFQHAGFMHLLFNMLLLLFTGRFVEFALGKRGMLILYFVSLYAAAYAEFAINGTSVIPIVGASGAGSGVIAAYMLLYAEKRANAWGPVPAYWARRLGLLALWLVLNLAVGLFLFPGGMQVAIVAHIGGFIAGLLLTTPLVELRYGRR